MNNKKSGWAFTLVELLVVISVIGLLMGILVPALGKARAVANRTYCMANLRQLGIAMRSYLDGNNDKFPLCCAEPWKITDTTNPDYLPPITKILGYILKEPKVFICKADNTPKPPDNKPYFKKTGNTSYWFKGRPQPPSSPICYQRDGLGGITIRESCEVQGGAKEKDIDVMSDFDAIHPGSAIGTESYSLGGRVRKVFKNYLYADGHVSNYAKQE
jgi:prepilin-type N-terminal cleavage/methylation domain-containing protein/prepilin-type processing-associated H-X9-DG protein